MKSESFILAGVRHYEDNIMSLLRENVDFDRSKQELKDWYMDHKVPEYVPKTDLQVVLEEEPTNQYDPNAVKVLMNGLTVGYIKSGSCTHVKNVIAAGIRKIFVKEIAIGRYKYVHENSVETESYGYPKITIVVSYGPEEAASPDPKVIEEASMKKAPVKEPRKGMKKRLIILAIFAWIILSALCYLLTPPLVLGIVIFTLVYNIFKRLKI